MAAWNRKLLWSFGGGSGTPYKQFAPNSTWQIDYALARGYLVAVSAHTDQQLNSNHAVAAETVMMGKEHIIERYGEINYTIGTGCSGGSIMQLQLASRYPGLLDGIQPSCTYPDSYSTGMEVGDCVMLDSYFASPQFAALTQGADAGAARGQESCYRRSPGRKGVPGVGDVVRPLEQSRRVHASAHEQADQQLLSARQPGLRRREESERRALHDSRVRDRDLGRDCPGPVSPGASTTTRAFSTD